MLSPTFSRIVPEDETSNWVKVFSIDRPVFKLNASAKRKERKKENLLVLRLARYTKKFE